MKPDDLAPIEQALDQAAARLAALTAENAALKAERDDPNLHSALDRIRAKAAALATA